MTLPEALEAFGCLQLWPQVDGTCAAAGWSDGSSKSGTLAGPGLALCVSARRHVMPWE